MILQLTSGKIIQISVEQYLDLTDEELDYLNNPGNNIGDYPKSLWLNSPIVSKKKKSENIEVDKDVDYIQEDEDIFFEEPLTTDTPIIDEIADIPESEEDLID